MAPDTSQVLEHLSRFSAAKWQAITSATESWPKTLRLCIILLVLQVPLDIGGVLWLILK
jgi:hypothetical protein